MHRPASLAGSTNLAGTSQRWSRDTRGPSLLHHAPPAAGCCRRREGQSPSRAADRPCSHAESLKRGEAGPPTCPALAKVPEPFSLPKPEVLDWIVGIARAKRQPKSSNSRSRSVFGWFGSGWFAPSCAKTGAAAASRDPRGSASRSLARHHSGRMPPGQPFTRSRRVHLPMPDLPRNAVAHWGCIVSHPYACHPFTSWRCFWQVEGWSPCATNAHSIENAR